MEPQRRPTAVVVGAIGALVVAAVIVVAVLTGTADDLPWGALIGIGIVLVVMAAGARRRRRRMDEAFGDNDEG
jgi:peptidoglycan/LPS O-acetylase OafA/YrhL